MKKMTGLGLIVLLVTLPLTAQSDGFAVGTRASLYTIFPGYGVELALPIDDKTNFRLTLDSGSANANLDVSGDSLATGVNTNATSAFVDWQVFGGNFRVTGGYVVNSNSATFSGTGTFGQPIPSTTIGGTIDFDNSPYVGIGLGNPVKNGRGLSFSVDAGVLIQGTPAIAITNQGGLSNPQKTQVENDIQNSLNQLPVLPVFSLGVAYQF